MRFTAYGQDNPDSNQLTGDAIQIDIFVDNVFVKCCGRGTNCQPSPAGPTMQPCTYDQVFASPGTHTYHVRVWDGILNTYTSQPQTFTVAADTQRPFINVKRHTITPQGSIVVEAEASDNVGVAGLYIYIDGQLGSSCIHSPAVTNTPVCVYTGTVTPGYHTYEVIALGVSSNQMTTSPLPFDTQPPVITKATHFFPPTTGPSATIMTGGTSGNPTVTIVGAATDNIGVASIRLYMDSQLAIKCDHSPSLPNPPDCVYTAQVAPGPHTYEVIAVDDANKYAQTGLKHFTTDRIPPHVDMSLSSGGTVLIPHIPPILGGMVNPTSPTGTPVSVKPKAPLTFTINAQDDVAMQRADLYVGGALVTSCYSFPCTHTLSLTVQGQYTFYAEAYDTSGNKAQTINSFFYVGTPPATPPPPPPVPVQIIVPVPVTGASSQMTCTCKDRLCSMLGAVTTPPPSNCGGWCTFLGSSMGLRCDAYTATQTPVAGSNTYHCTCDKSVCQNIPPVTFPSSTFSAQCMNYCLGQTFSRNLMAQGAFCI